jgi:hypothetical protein
MKANGFRSEACKILLACLRGSPRFQYLGGSKLGPTGQANRIEISARLDSVYTIHSGPLKRTLIRRLEHADCVIESSLLE